ncbi:MAG: pyridoxamine 5'-phosphate oxidase family protein [Acidimicrobiia bacterium]|nr:pyridoxamine 5'-phosphate oxidase family protein [Acidimicrobiia bacterium]MDH4306572.1 pyridoxamine 5'-phosphate oxidase family protein [Acidimicrobiia bacterium]MDH5295476.1 pyridoxamine 5'-phosphate oxidase family protein [Acidimicrobiia bacterium]
MSSDSPSTTVRKAERGAYDPDTVNAIIDEAPVCQVGFLDDGWPVVIPTLHVRVDDHIYLHGSHATRMIRTLKKGVRTCVTVSILDGLVLARSALHHSVNYRSAVVFGESKHVGDLETRRRVLDALVDKIAPERRSTLRPMTEDEVRKTAVVSIPIEHASAKIRSGSTDDDPADTTLPAWGGVIPVSLVYGAPEPDEFVDPSATEPEHLGFFLP